MSKEAVKTIRKKIQNLVKELSQNEEIGLDQGTLMRFFESKTENLLQAASVNRFTFDETNGNYNET